MKTAWRGHSNQGGGGNQPWLLWALQASDRFCFVRHMIFHDVYQQFIMHGVHAAAGTHLPADATGQPCCCAAAAPHLDDPHQKAYAIDPIAHGAEREHSPPDKRCVASVAEKVSRGHAMRRRTRNVYLYFRPSVRVLCIQ
jgi:hypothetical protein